MTVTHLATGDYEVQDVECQKCSVALGWTYLKAFNEVCPPPFSHNNSMQLGHAFHHLGVFPILGATVLISTLCSRQPRHLEALRC